MVKRNKGGIKMKKNIILGIIFSIILIICGAVSLIFGFCFDLDINSKIYDITRGVVIIIEGLVMLGFFIGNFWSE